MYVHRAIRMAASASQKLPSFALPLQYSTVEAVTFALTLIGTFVLYGLLSDRSSIFHPALLENFVPFKYIDRTTAGQDIRPYINSLQPYVVLSFQIFGPLLSLAIPHGWLISVTAGTMKSIQSAIKVYNSTSPVSGEAKSDDIVATAGELLLKIARIWIRTN